MKQVVLVDWIDSAAYSKGWLYEQEGHVEPMHITTVGFLMAENDDYITISAHHAIDNHNGTYGPMAIPRGCITHIQVLSTELQLPLPL